MYAVVKIKGQQFRVEPGNKLQVPLLDDEVGADVTFEEVLMFADGDEIKVGNPNVEGATVAAEVWIRPDDSVTGTRCTRWVPHSYFKVL